MTVEKTPLDGVLILKPKRFSDERGAFFESYNKQTFQKNGLEYDFVQDNESTSGKGVLRGLHFQSGEMAQAKLVRVSRGSVFDVAVDLRANSSTFGKWFGLELSAENGYQLLIPRGFAHGFVALEDNTVFSYKCDNFYSKDHDGGIRFDDPQIAIQWPKPTPKFIVSEKDLALPMLNDARGAL